MLYWLIDGTVDSQFSCRSRTAGKDPVKRSWIVIAVDVVQFTVGNTLTGPIDGPNRRWQ